MSCNCRTCKLPSPPRDVGAFCVMCKADTWEFLVVGADGVVKCANCWNLSNAPD